MQLLNSIGLGRLSTFLPSSWLCSVHQPVLPLISFLRYFLLSPLAFRARCPSNHTSSYYSSCSYLCLLHCWLNMLNRSDQHAAAIVYGGTFFSDGLLL